MGRIGALLLLVVGAFAAPAAYAAWVEDRLVHVHGDGSMEFQQHGVVVLQGVILQPSANDWLKAHREQAVLVRSSGVDRYGRARLVVAESRARNAPSWQQQLLQENRATAYDRAALPKSWLNAERAQPTIDPQQAGAHVGKFVQVKGTVTRSFKSRDMYYINFGDDWKTDFSLRIPRRAWRSFGKDFTIADGAHVVARGAVFLDNGPMIELTRPEQLQVESTHADAG